MGKFYFTPVFVSKGPNGQPQYDPGTVVDDELVSAFELLPPRAKFPVCDRDRTPMRFVARMPGGWVAPDDWVSISRAEANDAYPGRV